MRKVLVVIVFILCSLLTSCGNLWQVGDTANISFLLKNFDTQKSYGLPQSSQSANIDEVNTVAVSLIDSDSLIVISTKVVPFQDNIASVSFESLAIVGKTIFAEITITTDDGVFFGTSNDVLIKEGENVITISDLFNEEEDNTDDKDDDDNINTTYTITYELNGGINDSDNPSSYDSDDSFEIKSPTKNDFTFGGWYETADFSGIAVSLITENTTGNKTFYAKWNELGKITRPTATTTLNYNGSEQEYVPNGFDSNTMELGGITERTDAGTYNLTVKPKDSFLWDDDNSNTTITLTWKILQVANEWITPPSISDWVEGATASNPSGEAKFGDIVFTYKPSAGGTASATKPTDVGAYLLVATVTGNSNYTGIFVEIPFDITAPVQIAELEYEFHNADKYYIVKSVISGTNVVVPSEYAGFPVTKIETATFMGNTTIQSVELPSTITNIPDDAFNGCTSLQSFNIKNEVTYVGSRAFQGCTSLTSVTIGTGINTINSEAFKSTGIKTISIPESVQTINTYAFTGSDLETITFVNPKITVINEGTFYSCEKLTSIEIPSTVETIEDFSFFGCIALETISIPTSVTTIDVNAFTNCTNLTITTNRKASDATGWDTNWAQYVKKIIWLP